MSNQILKEIPTVCGFCHNNCGLIANVRNNELVRVTGNPDHPANWGYICPKGAAAKQVVYAPDRLMHPLRRTGSGFEKISWDEALDTIASRLLELREKHGSQTLVRAGGAGVTETTNNGFRQLVTSYGSANMVGPSHLCHQPRHIAFKSTLGGMTHPDFARTKLILVWGSNPLESRWLSNRLAVGKAASDLIRIYKAARKRGVKIIVIDPRRTKLADFADQWLQIEPGRDDALALAMLNVIIKEERYDKAFVANWTVGFNRLAEHIAPFTPDWAEGITQIASNDIQQLAREYASVPEAIIQDGNGFDQYPNAVQTARAVGILCAITGHFDTPGSNAIFPVSNLTPLITQKTSSKPLGADRFPLVSKTPFPFLVDALLTGKPYSPQAMIVYHTNPLLIHGNSNRVRQAFNNLNLLVVCDIFMTATAELADIILPESSEYERYGFRHYYCTEGGFVALSSKVIEPLGETRSVFEIEYELAKRMGLAEDYRWTNDIEWVNYRLKATGLTVDDLRVRPIMYTTGPLEFRKYLKEGFNTPSNKVEIFSSEFQKHGYSPLPIPGKLDQSPAYRKHPEKFPLIGTTRRPGAYTHSRFRNIPPLRKIEPEPMVRMSVDAAQDRKISAGEIVKVTAPNGSITLRAMVTDELSSNVVAIDFGWGNPGDGGANVNVLTDDEERDPISCSTPNRRFRCQVIRLQDN